MTVPESALLCSSKDVRWYAAGARIPNVFPARRRSDSYRRFARAAEGVLTSVLTVPSGVRKAFTAWIIPVAGYAEAAQPSAGTAHWFVTAIK